MENLWYLITEFHTILYHTIIFYLINNLVYWCIIIKHNVPIQKMQLNKIIFAF